MQDKKMTTCLHCGKVVKKRNFCNKCGKKLADMCDCMASPKLTALQKQYIIEALEASFWVECYDEEEFNSLENIRQKLKKGYGLASIEEGLLKKWLTGKGPHSTKSKFARAYMADIAENLKDWDEEVK